MNGEVMERNVPLVGFIFLCMLFLGCSSRMAASAQPPTMVELVLPLWRYPQDSSDSGRLFGWQDQTSFRLKGAESETQHAILAAEAELMGFQELSRAVDLRAKWLFEKLGLQEQLSEKEIPHLKFADKQFVGFVEYPLELRKEFAAHQALLWRNYVGSHFLANVATERLLGDALPEIDQDLVGDRSFSRLAEEAAFLGGYEGVYLVLGDGVQRMPSWEFAPLESFASKTGTDLFRNHYPVGMVGDWPTNSLQLLQYHRQNGIHLLGDAIHTRLNRVDALGSMSITSGYMQWLELEIVGQMWEVYATLLPRVEHTASSEKEYPFWYLRSRLSASSRRAAALELAARRRMKSAPESTRRPLKTMFEFDDRTKMQHTDVDNLVRWILVDYLMRGNLRLQNDSALPKGHPIPFDPRTAFAYVLWQGNRHWRAKTNRDDPMMPHGKQKMRLADLLDDGPSCFLTILSAYAPFHPRHAELQAGIAEIEEHLRTHYSENAEPRGGDLPQQIRHIRQLFYDVFLPHIEDQVFAFVEATYPSDLNRKASFFEVARWVDKTAPKSKSGNGHPSYSYRRTFRLDDFQVDQGLLPIDLQAEPGLLELPRLPKRLLARAAQEAKQAYIDKLKAMNVEVIPIDDGKSELSKLLDDKGPDLTPAGVIALSREEKALREKIRKQLIKEATDRHYLEFIDPTWIDSSLK